jgi:hypothetical protein
MGVGEFAEACALGGGGCAIAEVEFDDAVGAGEDVGLAPGEFEAAEEEILRISSRRKRERSQIHLAASRREFGAT